MPLIKRTRVYLITLGLPILIPALAYGNLVQNPSMEGSFISQPPLGEVAEYWTGWSNADEPGSFSEGSYAHDGSKSQQISWDGCGYKSFGPEGICQQVGPLQTGQPYRALVWFTSYFESYGTFKEFHITYSIGADPNGGTEPSLVTNWIDALGEGYEDWIPVTLCFLPNGTIATLFVRIGGWGDAVIVPEGPFPWIAKCYIDDVVVEPIQIGQGSTVEAIWPVPADGVSYSEVTITVLDSNSNPIEGIPPSEIIVNCTGSGNVIYGPYVPTNRYGLTTAYVASTVAEIKTVSVTVLGTPLSDTATVEFIPYWVKLTMLTSPSDVNAVAPTVGEHNCARNSVVDISAGRFIDCPDVYVFDHWEGDVNDPNSADTTIIMDANETVTAVFVDGRQCGDECHPYPVVDFDKDCEVTFADFALFASHWLECTKPECD